MEAAHKILDEIRRKSVNGRYFGCWFLEGSKQEKDELCKLLNGVEFQKASNIWCVRMVRHPPYLNTILLGQPYRECIKLYKLTIAIN